MTEAPREAVRIEAIRVRADRIEASVAVSSERYRMSDPALVRRCLRFAPTMVHHACRNEVGPLFSFVMESTSVPHLLEHMVIDAQTRCAHNASRVFTGATQWDEMGSLTATVSLSYEDDLETLRCLSQAVSFLNDALIELRG